jgi:hypothetical protein
MPTDYTALSLEDIHAELGAVSREAASVFGGLTREQLNWKPAPSQWSVAQCFDHLITINGLMLSAMANALDPARPRSLAQRLPLLPGLFGRLMIRSLSPTATRKLPAPATAQPSASAIDADIITRFVAAQAAMQDRLRSFASRDLARTIMVSPFASFIAYSTLDACRLIAAHERRHFEQARRVLASQR